MPQRRSFLTRMLFPSPRPGWKHKGLNPRAVAVMAQNGVDISAHTSDVLTDEMLAAADLVVSVCSHADTNCPLLPAGTAKRHLPFTDPAQATGSEADISACFQSVCGEIRDAMAALIHELSANSADVCQTGFR